MFPRCALTVTHQFVSHWILILLVVLVTLSSFALFSYSTTTNRKTAKILYLCLYTYNYHYILLSPFKLFIQRNQFPYTQPSLLSSTPPSLTFPKTLYLTFQFRKSHYISWFAHIKTREFPRYPMGTKNIPHKLAHLMHILRINEYLWKLFKLIGWWIGSALFGAAQKSEFKYDTFYSSFPHFYI